MAKAGPKPIQLDTEQLENLASIGCTVEEIAAFFKCSRDTIFRNYATPLQAGRERGKSSVRRMLWEQGKKGNSVALKYLIHNVLKEKLEEPAPATTLVFDENTIKTIGNLSEKAKEFLERKKK